MQVRLLPTFLAAFVGFLIENTRHLGAPSASTRGPAVWLASTWVRGPVSLALSPTLCLSPGAAEALHRRGPRRATRSQALRFQSVSWRVFRRGAGALAGRVCRAKGCAPRGGTSRRTPGPGCASGATGGGCEGEVSPYTKLSLGHARPIFAASILAFSMAGRRQLVTGTRRSS